jgi:L-lactate dehydrogenase complex protein LldE
MVKHFHELFPEEIEWRERAENIAAKTHEFTSFLVNVLKVEKLDSSFHGKVTWHDACHGLRELNLNSEPRTLLKNLDGAEFVEMPNSDACCGFGGTFSVKYPEISVAILDKKIEGIEKSGADVVVSCDASCLMQIGGRLSRRGSRVKTMHIAEILAGQSSEQ